MAYKDMFTVLVVDSRIERSQSLHDAFQRILGHLRDERGAGAGGLLGGDSAFRDGHVVSPPGW